MKEEIVTIRMNADLKEALQKLADKDQRNLSDYLRLQLKKLVETGKKK